MAECHVPVWDSLCFEYSFVDLNMLRQCRFDHGMMGVDINRPQANCNTFSVHFPKACHQKCFHSTTLSAPCVSPKKVPNYFMNNLNYTKCESEQVVYVKAALKNIRKMNQYKEHIEVIDRLLLDPKNVFYKDLPKCLKRYKKVLDIVPETEMFWQHHGGTLTSAAVKDKVFALFSGGEDFNKLMGLEMEDGDQEEIAIQKLKPKVIKTFDNNNGPILQVTATKMDDIVLGAVRQRKQSCIFQLINECKIRNLETLTSDDAANQILDVKPSQYMPEEFVYITQNGEIFLKHLGKPSQRQINHYLINPENHPRYIHFGSHPRALIVASDNQVRLIDFRKSCERSLPLLTLPDTTLPVHDVIGTSSKLIDFENLTLVTTSTSVLLLDQRYPGKYLLKWTHLLNDRPQFTSVQRQERDITILAGSTKSQDIAFIHAEVESDSIFTRCPTMHLTRPSDLLHFVPEGSAHLAASFISAPIIGVEIFTKDSGNSRSVMQATASGCVYMQNINIRECENSTSEWRVGPGMPHTYTALSDGVVKWANKYGKICSEQKKVKKCKDFLNATRLKDYLHVGNVEDQIPVNPPTNIFDRDGEFSHVMEFGLDDLYGDMYTDKASRHIFSEWQESDDEM